MKENHSLEYFLRNGDKEFLPHVSVDCAIFGFHENKLRVLLLKWKDDGPWCLPGGFVKRNEALDDSATRTLKERTGLKNIFLHQFHTFGDPLRDKVKFNPKKISLKGTWFTERFVSVGYYALLEFSKVSPQPDWLSEECKWWDVKRIPKLMYDHTIIVRKALETLRLSLNDQPVGLNLLPAKFTMPQLQSLYETILDRKLDRRNFQKKILALKILERLPERKTGGAHKAPFLYQFNKSQYNAMLRKGLMFI